MNLREKYVAGLIDAKGLICLDKYYNKRYQTTEYRVYLKFISQKISFLQSIKNSINNIAEGYIIRGSLQSSTGQYLYILYYSAKKTLDILKVVSPHLKYKKDEARLLMNFHKKHLTKKKNGKLTIEEINNREKIYKELRKLKQHKKKVVF